MLTPCRHGISGKMITPSHCGVGGSTPLTGMRGMDLVSCAICSPELAYRKEELFPWGFELMSIGLGVLCVLCVLCVGDLFAKSGGRCGWSVRVRTARGPRDSHYHRGRVLEVRQCNKALRTECGGSDELRPYLHLARRHQVPQTTYSTCQ